MGTPFISRDDLSDYLGRDVAADDGATIVVDAACEMVRTMTEQTLDAVSEDTITLDGTGTDAIILPQLPVNGAGTVNMIGSDGGTTAVTNYALKGNGVLLRTRGSAAAEEDYVETSWPIGRQNVEVTYDHGYDSVPEDLRFVALTLASRMIVQGVASEESQATERVRYGTNATDFTDGERAIMHKYRQVG